MRWEFRSRRAIKALDLRHDRFHGHGGTFPARKRFFLSGNVIDFEKGMFGFRFGTVMSGQYVRR